jgi:hypothetical protein
MILLVTMLGMVSVTYYFSIERVNAQSQTLKVATAKQDMMSLDEAVLSVLWQPGSSREVEFGDSGGALTVQAAANSANLKISCGDEMSVVLFNGSLGQTAYALPYSSSIDIGVFLKGDSRTIVNQSASGVTQLGVTQGAEHPEIQLRYRPILSYREAGVEDGRPVNCLRVYIITLNSSGIDNLMGAIPLGISCVSTEMTTASYMLNQADETALVTCGIGQESGQIIVPIESSAEGAIIQVEIVLCLVEIGRVVR